MVVRPKPYRNQRSYVPHEKALTQRAKKTIELDNDILIRKDGKKIVGLTILNAGARVK